MNSRTLLLTVILLLGAVGTAAGVSPVAAGSTGSGDGQTSSAAFAAQESDCTFPYSATDTTGTEVTVEERPERIVVLQPSDAQLVWEIGAEDRVVGMPVTQYTAYIEGREGITNVKNSDGSINVEQVVGLNPDVVIASNVTSIETVRQLRQAGITVYHFGLVTSVDEIAGNVERVGRLTGECDGADAAVARFRGQVRAVQRAAEFADDRPRVLYYFFQYTTGSGTHIHNVIETAGGENVAAAAGLSGYQPVNAEIVADRDPEWIVYPSDATLPEGAPYNGTTAVQEGQTVALNSQYISQPGPRVIVPMTQLARAFHPEALDRANESTAETPTPTATESQPITPATTETAGSPDSTPTPVSETTTTRGPGFGVVATLAALLALVLLARRL